MISLYGTRYSVLILHGAQVPANLSHLQPGFLLVYVLFCFSPGGELFSGSGVGGSCQDWTCRDETGIEVKGLQAKSHEPDALKGRGNPEAQPVHYSWQDRETMSWRSKQAESGAQMFRYLITTALAGRKVILGPK